MQAATRGATNKVKVRLVPFCQFVPAHSVRMLIKQNKQWWCSICDKWYRGSRWSL